MDAKRVPPELMRSIVAHFDPVQIILFGSQARGEQSPESDLDLVVVVDDHVDKEKLTWRSVYEARREYDGAVDLFPCRQSVFRERAKIIGSFAHTVSAEGVVVYERG